MILNFALISLHFVSHSFPLISFSSNFAQYIFIYNISYMHLFIYVSLVVQDNNTLGITNINVNVDNNIYNNCNYNNNSISSNNSIHSLFLCFYIHPSFLRSASTSFRYVSIPFRLNKCIWKYFNNRFSFKFHVSYIVFIFIYLYFNNNRTKSI